jgi:uncharacterized protein (DUF2062 family)
MTSKLKNWLKKHSLKLLAIRDTPEAIAGGVAIGIFFGFTPLFGLKTILSLLFAWLTGCNLLAAVVAVTLHDVALPFLPLLFRWEYDIGYWLLSNPHQWPPRFTHVHLGPHGWGSWTTFVTIGKPWLIGSAVLGVPIAVPTFFLTRRIIIRHRAKHPHPPAEPRDAGTP